MKLFPDNETKKRFMRIWLPYILGFAWVPIIWILFIAVLGPLLFVLTGSWILVQIIILFLSIYVVYLLLRIFRRFNLRFYGKKTD